MQAQLDELYDKASKRPRTSAGGQQAVTAVRRTRLQDLAQEVMEGGTSGSTILDRLVRGNLEATDLVSETYDSRGRVPSPLENLEQQSPTGIPPILRPDALFEVDSTSDLAVIKATILLAQNVLAGQALRAGMTQAGRQDTSRMKSTDNLNVAVLNLGNLSRDAHLAGQFKVPSQELALHNAKGIMRQSNAIASHPLSKRSSITWTSSTQSIGCAMVQLHASRMGHSVQKRMQRSDSMSTVV